jgi:hypothetical protein
VPVIVEWNRQWNVASAVRLTTTVFDSPGGMSTLALPSSSVKLCSEGPAFVMVMVVVPELTFRVPGANWKSFTFSVAVAPPPPPLVGGAEELGELEALGELEELLLHAAPSRLMPTSAVTATVRSLIGPLPGRRVGGTTDEPAARMAQPDRPSAMLRSYAVVRR